MGLTVCDYFTQVDFLPFGSLNSRARFLYIRMKTNTFMRSGIVRAKSGSVRMVVERSIDSVVHRLWYDNRFRFHEADFPEDSLELIRRKWRPKLRHEKWCPSVKLRRLVHSGFGGDFHRSTGMDNLRSN